MKFKLLKEKNFSLLMFGKVTSLIGSYMQSFALSLFVLSTTGSATKFASILAISLIPNLIFSPISGVIVDWFYRKNILIFLDLVSGIAVSIFAIFYLYVLMLIITLLMCVFIGISNTCLNSGMQSVVPLEFLGRVSTVVSTGCMIASPLSSILYGYLFDKISVSSIFLISSGIMVVSMLLFKKSLLEINLEKDENEALMDI